MNQPALNVFQRLTRQWDKLHPYNAAQAMKLAGLADHDRFAWAWQKTLCELGLAETGQSGLLCIRPATSVDELMSAELNRRFDDSLEPPFRAFVLADGENHWAGIVYHHWVADSFSVRLLMREWFLRVHDPAAARRLPLCMATEGYWKLYGPGRSGWSLGRAALDIIQFASRVKRVRRLDPECMEDLSTSFTLHHVPQGLIDAMTARAKAAGVTVNDVFLAALAQVCDRLVPARSTRQRIDLALGTIVDLRWRGRPIDRAFGLLLGFTCVFCRPADLLEWDRLLRRIHQQTASHRRNHSAEASMVRMAAGLLVAKMLQRRGLLEFYRKRLPLAGGISNVNLNRDWPVRYHPRPLLDYVRVSPCGPMMPIVLTPTTLGQNLNIGMTYRSKVLSVAQAGLFADMFLARLRTFAKL